MLPNADLAQKRALVEEAVRSSLAHGDLRGAFERGVEGFGPEVLGYLVAVLRDEERARDAYAELLEQLWRSLPRFEGLSSFRTWTYALAFRLAARQRRRVRRRREDSLGRAPEWLCETARASTAAYQRTAARDWLSRVRAELTPSEQSLLTLRVDRALAWEEVSAVLGLPAPALRKRFERIKTKLRSAAEQEGVLGKGERS